MKANSDCFQYSIAWKGADKHRELASFLQSMRSVIALFGELSPLYSRWYHLGNSRGDSLDHQVNLGTLEEEILSKNPKYKKQPGFGLTFSIWNGGSEDQDVNFSFRGLSETPSVDDFFSLRMPYNLEAVENEVLVNGGVSLFKRLKELRPTFCLLTSDHLMDCWRNLDLAGLPVGYRTMVSSKESFYDPLGVTAEKTEINGHTLFSLSGEPTKLSQTEKMILARRVFDLGVKRP